MGVGCGHGTFRTSYGRWPAMREMPDLSWPSIQKLAVQWASRGWEGVVVIIDAPYFQVRSSTESTYWDLLLRRVRSSHLADSEHQVYRLIFWLLICHPGVIKSHLVTLGEALHHFERSIKVMREVLPRYPKGCTLIPKHTHDR